MSTPKWPDGSLFTELTYDALSGLFGDRRIFAPTGHDAKFIDRAHPVGVNAYCHSPEGVQYISVGGQPYVFDTEHGRCGSAFIGYSGFIGYSDISDSSGDHPMLTYMEEYLPNWKHLRTALNTLPVSHADWRY